MQTPARRTYYTVVTIFRLLTEHSTSRRSRATPTCDEGIYCNKNNLYNTRADDVSASTESLIAPCNVFIPRLYAYLARKLDQLRPLNLCESTSVDVDSNYHTTYLTAVAGFTYCVMPEQSLLSSSHFHRNSIPFGPWQEVILLIRALGRQMPVHNIDLSSLSKFFSQNWSIPEQDFLPAARLGNTWKLFDEDSLTISSGATVFQFHLKMYGRVSVG